MNVHAQVPGHVPNQGGPQPPGLAPQNAGSLPPQMQGVGAVSNMDPDMLVHRKLVCDKITQIFHLKRPNAELSQRLPDIVRRLEERLYRSAMSKDDYLNMATLESRLQAILRSLPNSQPPAHPISSSSPVSTMIRTPGISHGNGSNTVVPSSLNNSVSTFSGSASTAPTVVITGDMLSSANGSLSSGYRQAPANVSAMSSGTNMMSSRGVPQLSSQMIPTPGLNVPQSLPMNSECGSTGGRFPSVQSSILSQQQQQQQQPWHHLQQPHEQDKQYLENQNSSMLHGIRTHIGADLRPDVQQRPSSYRSSNGIVNGGGALVGKNAQIMNGPLASDGYLSATPYGASPRPLQKHIEQQQHQPILSVSSSRQVMPVSRDGYGVNAAELSGAGNLYDLATTVGTTINRQNMNSMNLQPKNKMYPLQGDQQNLQLMQQISHLKPPSFDHSQKMNFHSVHTTGDHLQSQQKMQKFQQQQQFQEQPDQPYGQVVQLQQQQKQIQQHQQHMLKNDALRQSTLASNFEGQMTSDQGMNACPEPLPTQAPEQFQVSEFQSQHQPNSTPEDHSKGTFIHFSEPQGFNLPFAQGSQRMHQIFHPLNQGSESQNEVNSLSTSSRSELLRGQWHPQALQKSQTLDVSSFEQHFQVDFHQRITGQDEAQQPHFSSEGSVTSHSVAATSATVPQLTCGGCEMKKSLRERQYLNQQRWLLFLLHARCCPSPKGKCQEVNCITVQHLLSHMRNCKVDQCGYPRCCQSKALIKHYRSCRAGDCPVCVPVRLYTTKQRKLSVHPTPNADFVNSGNASWKTMNDADADRSMQSKGISTRESSVDLQSSFKRMKVDLPSSAIAHSQSHLASASLMNPSHSSQEVKPQGHQQVSRTLMTKMEIVEMKTESLIPSELENPHNLTHSNMDVSEDVYSSRPDAENVLSKVHDSNKKTESMLIDGQTDQATVNIKQEASAPVPDAVATKSGKPKIKGVSMTELFTPDQIREHIFSLRQWVGQSKAKAEKNQAMERSMSENSCQLCAVEKLTFEPPPIYCSPCGARIKRNATYYTIGMGETRHYFCTPCYHEARGDSIEAEGTACPKSKLEKKKNDEETEEAWVLCDKCEAWQHQICALFNGRRNDGEAEYTCPNCYVQEIERGERMPLPQSAVLGAKDLPRTLLSDHIEQRLFKRLKLEKQERARHLGKNIDEVPGAEALVVRVVSSVDKKLEVKQRFLEMFQEENYPAEFPYKSKVILLFQRIDGVEVCLFGMYVQEFGTECPFPNQRRVYLSYLDSVKYFRPEIKTITGEALRTFVYHEILIGYLEYCKKRGFTSCYIWACPPLKGEDYILYCHPEIQKTPKSDKLREWYLSMLRKAMKEEIVVDLTNLYDNFFVPIGECKAKVTAARLPYFDGDYWPGAAEDMINQLQQEEDGRKQQKKGKAKKIITKRSLKATCQADLSSNASKDILLMQKLGDTISPMKEDFIMVHLQHACTHCCVLMVSGIRWVCNQCKNFQLCDKCYNVEQRREDRERHPIGSKEKHLLRPVEINDVAMDTKDKDEIIESEFFGTRQAFLSLCQGNHYQYDTLRRAKHSSMMVLFHLHNPTEPAFVTTCNVCHHDIESGQGWRCEVCLDFDVCNKCYQRDGGVDHPHRLTNHPSMADRDAQTKEARQKRVLQLRKMLDLLVHASQCRSLHCQYPNCRGVKKLFRHGINCKQRASGGCPQCKRMWELLQLHARACKESQCHVPRCRDLRDHFRRLQQQSDSRRRAAVLEMIMRQRAAEVAESGG